jgi:hypothetical protein
MLLYELCSCVGFEVLYEEHAQVSPNYTALQDA